jgi:quercetin dioxygenase-like cupin family protein
MPVLLPTEDLLPEADLDRFDLAALVADLANDPYSWRHLIQPACDRHWKRCLLRDQGVSAWLVGWPAALGTDLHAHGPAVAGLSVVEGRLTHTLASHGAFLREPLAEGTLLTVEPGAVHSIRNPTCEPAMSIHAYSPGLERSAL